MSDRKPAWPRVTSGVVCWALLAASTAFPAVHVDGDGNPQRGGNFYGWALLIFGWYPIDVEDQEALRKADRDELQRGQVPPFRPRTFWIWPAWFANVFFVFGTAAMMLRRYRVAIVIGAVSVALALTSTLVHNIYCGDLMYHGRVDGYGPAFFLWQSAMGLSFVAPIGLWALSRRPRVQGDESEMTRPIELDTEGLPKV